MEQQSSFKAKVIGGVVTLVVLLVVWALFKRTLLMIFNGFILLVIAYALIRFWLWRRRRRSERS